MSDCNVQCGKTPYHTYQNSIGKLSIYNANTDPLGQAKAIEVKSAQSTTFSVPKNSVLLGWYKCDSNVSKVMNPAANFSYSALDTNVTLPLTTLYITNPLNLNVLENEINSDRSVHPDDYTTLPRMMQRMNQLGFFTCDFTKMIGQSSNFMNGNPNRNITIFNADLLQDVLAAPVYLDLSWLYGTNI